MALVVLGFILAGLSQGAQFGLLAAGSQARTVAERGELDAVDRAVRRLIQGMDPGRVGAPPGLRGTASSLALTSALPAASALPVRQAAMVLAAEDGRLVLRATPRFPGVGASVEMELLRGVERLEASYWSRGGQPRWVSSWVERELPALIRLRLVFPSGDRRRWPDIIVAPMRNPAG